MRAAMPTRARSSREISPMCAATSRAKAPMPSPAPSPQSCGISTRAPSCRVRAVCCARLLLVLARAIHPIPGCPEPISDEPAATSEHGGGSGYDDGDLGKRFRSEHVRADLFDPEDTLQRPGSAEINRKTDRHTDHKDDRPSGEPGQ